MHQKLGLTDEVLEESLRRTLAGESEPFPDRQAVRELEKKLGRRQRLIRVWEFALDDGRKPLIFELADGSLWQLSDVGLGWTQFHEIGPGWTEHPAIEAHLPADILPRPQSAAPWDYEITLANGAALWAKPGRQKQDLQMGLAGAQGKRYPTLGQPINLLVGLFVDTARCERRQCITKKVCVFGGYVVMFLELPDGRAHDYDMEFLEDLLQLLDGHVERLAANVPQDIDADSWGLYDSTEYIIGLGFVACQGYLAATYSYLNIEKVKVLKGEPKHPSGLTYVEIINHAGNFWKHHDEWSLPSNKGRGHACEALDKLLGDEPCDPLTSILGAVVFARSNRLQALLPYLRAWRDALPRPSEETRP